MADHADVGDGEGMGDEWEPLEQLADIKEMAKAFLLPDPPPAPESEGERQEK